MKYVEIIADADSSATVLAAAEKVKAEDVRFGGVGDDGMRQMRLLVTDDHLQEVLDTLQALLGAQPTARIVVLPVEVSLPQPAEPERKKEDRASAAREALYGEVERGAQLDANFLLLVVLSTIVAAIGLIEDNAAVVIGAMVIAPLLGPNLALSLGTALGDMVLVRKAILTLIAGVALAIVLSLFIGAAWPTQTLGSHELLARTHASLGSIILALASGAAATLSLTTGLPGVLVGVMVAVALLPPAVTAGIMLGAGQMGLAGEAALLLVINVVCVNLASKLVFLLKDVHPRTWVEKEQAKQAMARYLSGWAITLLILVMLLIVRGA